MPNGRFWPRARMVDDPIRQSFNAKRNVPRSVQARTLKSAR
jgi:hypothetical protein